jgi:hypothetical protein
VASTSGCNPHPFLHFKKFNTMKIYNVKKWSLMLLLIATVLVGPSCSELFLEEDLTTAYSTQYFETEAGLEALAISLYGNIRWHFGFEWGYGTTLYGTDEFTNANDLTNEMWNTYDNRFGPIGATPSTGAANGNATSPTFLWDQLYYGIASANRVIANADNIENEEVRNRSLAHAHFLRGYNYYKLTAQYGAVALQLEPAEGVVRDLVRSSPEECWGQIISDFRDAYNYFEGEVFTYGKGITWTKATAAHFLAKALLFRSSERNSDWNAGYIANDLDEAVAACTYTINSRTLENEYRNLYGNWTGVDCPAEQSDEILMAAGFNGDEVTQGRFGNRTHPYFNPQFSAFSAGWVNRGVWIGGMDFQRCRPTEYTYAAFDHVNDSRMWKTFKTVYGINNVVDANLGLELGDPAVVMILNTEDDNTYDGYTFGANIQGPNWKDDAGRLPEWTRGERQTPTSGSLSDTVGQYVPSSLVLYQNGQYVAPNFTSTPITNFFAGINKCEDGTRQSERGDSFRDVTMARVAETYLLRAECFVRQGDYMSAMNDINVIRERAEWKEGENRSYYVDGSVAFEENELNVGAAAENYLNSNLEMNTYYLSNPNLEVTTAASDLTLTSFPNNLPPEDEAILANIGASSQYERALHFILNERTRELLGEWQRWETLSRTGTLLLRTKAFNKEALGITANKHELRPVPQNFIDGILNEDGTNLSADQRAVWQNPGY